MQPVLFAQTTIHIDDVRPCNNDNNNYFYFKHARPMTNIEIVVTKTERVDCVPYGTHNKWLRSIRTTASINGKKNTHVIYICTFERMEKEEWTGLDVVTLYWVYHPCDMFDDIFFCLQINLDTPRGHTCTREQLMEFHCPWDMVFLGLYHSDSFPIIQSCYFILIALHTCSAR